MLSLSLSCLAFSFDFTFLILLFRREVDSICGMQREFWKKQGQHFPLTHKAICGCAGSLRMGEVAQRVDCWPTAEKVPGSVLSTVGTGHGSPIMEDQELKAILVYLVNSGAAWDT